MVNKNWRDPFSGVKPESTDGAKGEGTVKETKTTYGEGTSKSGMDSNGDKINSNIGSKGKF